MRQYEIVLAYQLVISKQFPTTYQLVSPITDDLGRKVSNNAMKYPKK